MLAWREDLYARLRGHLSRTARHEADDFSDADADAAAVVAAATAAAAAAVAAAAAADGAHDVRQGATSEGAARNASSVAVTADNALSADSPAAAAAAAALDWTVSAELASVVQPEAIVAPVAPAGGFGPTVVAFAGKRQYGQLFDRVPGP